MIESLAAEDRDQRPDSARTALHALGADEDTPSMPVVTPERSDQPAPRTIVIKSQKHSGRSAAFAGLAVLAVVAVVAIAQVIGGGGDESSNGSGNGSNASDSSQNDSSGSGSGQGSNSGSGSGSGSGGGASAASAEEAAALDREGFALLRSGDPETAIPILERAVGYYPEDSTDIDYAYALYNLGDALFLAGRPDEAIPYLEKRLAVQQGAGGSSEQAATAEARLEEAREAAGEGD